MKSDWTLTPACHGALEIGVVFLFFAHVTGLALCRDSEPRAEGWSGSCDHDFLPPPPPPISWRTCS